VHRLAHHSALLLAIHRHAKTHHCGLLYLSCLPTSVCELLPLALVPSLAIFASQTHFYNFTGAFIMMFTDYSKAHRMLSALTRWASALLLSLLFGLAHAQSKSNMALLLPDGLALTDLRVSAWTDAAKEQGYSMVILRNADLLLLGAGARATYSGIIIPDQLQVTMSDALVNTIQNYVAQGGNILLVYDAGALNPAGFYAIPKSRFSDLVGVDYVLYDQLRDRTVGLGPVTGLMSTLRSLLVAPGKSMPYTAPPAAVVANQDVASMRFVADQSGGTPGRRPSPTTRFLPVNPANPGGLVGHDHEQYFRPPPPSQLTPDRATGQPGRALQPGGKPWTHKHEVQREPVVGVTPVRFSKNVLQSLTRSREDDKAWAPAKALRVQAAATVPDAVHSISGYVYGPLSYPSFATLGAAQGAILMASPEHGVVASSRAFGAGNVLFVNLPLTYLKLSEDAMPMHGFVHLFARGLLRQPRLTAVPNGIGGLVFNWHLDSNAALQPMQALKNLGVWNNKPFSIDMTAGPDTIATGDKLGFDLPHNPVAQQFLREFVAAGHEVGSHGGWIHDYYGNNANESNAAEFLPYLVLNRNAIEAVIQRPIQEYSAPQGNNPLWALSWLTGNGVGSYYSLSHTGTAPTLSYRGGQLVAPSLWAMPLVPFGVAATFEEFSELGIPASEMTQWYCELVDFAAANNTSRLIYAHPPGAMLYPGVMTSMLSYAKQKQLANSFRWYTMNRLANFMTTRSQTVWTSALSSTGRMRVTASHPANLASLTWAFAKNRYARPVVISGKMTVIDQGGEWLVQVNSGRAAVFEAAAL